MLYDLLIRNGRVIDPAQGLDRSLDVAIRDGCIVHTAVGVDPTEARRTIDVGGMLVTPGLIDLHAHVYWGVTSSEVSDLNAPLDLVGVRSGVTTVVDAGSAGFQDWAGFARYVASGADTRVFAFLSMYRETFLGGMVGESDRLIDIDATIRTINANRPLLQGVKVLLNGPVIDRLGMDIVRLATRAARETGTHVMVHIGDHRDPPSPRAASLTRELLEALAPGDILSHLCTGRQGGVLDAAGRPVPELLAARERGVVLDSALGRLNFSFRAARALLDQGIVPDTISSDMTGRGRGLIVYSLAECMSKFLALGFSLPQVVRMTTANSAAALGMSGALGSLAVGREADLSILQLVPGRWEFRDSLDDTLSGDQALAPVATVRAGQLIMPDWGPHPWGWLPAPGPGGQRVG